MWPAGLPGIQRPNGYQLGHSREHGNTAAGAPRRGWSCLGSRGPGGEPAAREGRRPGNVVGARGVVVVVEDVEDVVVDAVAVVEAVVVGVQRVVTAPGAVLPGELQLLLPTAAVGTVRQPVPCCSPD